MTQTMIDVPAALAALPAEERDALLRAGLFEAIQARVRQLQLELAEARQRIADLERRFGYSWAELDTQGLPESASPADHEAYVDFAFWQAVATEKEQLLATLAA